MTLNQLIDRLNDLVIEEGLTGDEPVADTGLFEVTGAKAVEAFNGSKYVHLTSEEYEKASSE